MKTALFAFLFCTVITLSACTSHINSDINSSPDAFIPSPTTAVGTWELELSSTWEIDLSNLLGNDYHYLDSENKSFSSGTLQEIISEYPNTVVYFYPKDGTPNCTIQALDFSMMLADFRNAWYNVIWVSKDSVDSHMQFANDNSLKIQLLQDGSGDLLKAFGSEWPLQEYGNGEELSDIIRSTYVIDSTGKALYAIRDVNAKWHARAVYKLITGNEYTK